MSVKTPELLGWPQPHVWSNPSHCFLQVPKHLPQPSWQLPQVGNSPSPKEVPSLGGRHAYLPALYVLSEVHTQITSPSASCTHFRYLKSRSRHCWARASASPPQHPGTMTWASLFSAPATPRCISPSLGSLLSNHSRA